MSKEQEVNTKKDDDKVEDKDTEPAAVLQSEMTDEQRSAVLELDDRIRATDKTVNWDLYPRKKR